MVPVLSYSLWTSTFQRFGLARFSQPWYLCASVSLIAFLLVEEFISLPFVFNFPTLCKSSVCIACQISSNSFGIAPLGLPYFLLSLSALAACSAHPAHPALPVLLALLALPAIHALPTLPSFPAIFSFFRPHFSVWKLYLLPFVASFHQFSAKLNLSMVFIHKWRGPFFFKQSTQSELFAFWKSLAFLWAGLERFYSQQAHLSYMVHHFQMFSAADLQPVQSSTTELRSKRKDWWVSLASRLSTPPLTERYSGAWIVYLLSWPFRTRRTPVLSFQ